MGRVPRRALERGRYQGEPEHYLPHRTQGTEKREGPALYPEEQNRQPYPSASRISCSDLEPSSDSTSDLEPSSNSTPRSAEWFPRQPRGGVFVFRGGRYQAHRREATECIVWDLGLDYRLNDEVLVDHQNGISVGWSLRSSSCADSATGTGEVLYVELAAGLLR